MGRPVMDTCFVSAAEPPAKRRRRQVLVPTLKWLGRLLLARPLVHLLSSGPRLPAGPTRLLLAAAGRQLVILPLVLAAFAGVMVYAGTHPTPAPITSDPGSQGVYFDPVELTGDDGTRLTGWIVPVIDAHRVIEQKEKILREHRPAVLLVHDFGKTQQQMLPLIQPLHEEGLVVLALGLRGAGNGKPAGQTFGLHEALDIKAAIDLLRRRPSVDPTRIAVVGVGTGATAALLAAEVDPSLNALVIADPVADANDAIARRIGPHESWLTWLQPASKWAFEISYRVNVDDVNFGRFVAMKSARPTLHLPNGSDRDAYFTRNRIGRVRNFLAAQLHTDEQTVTAAAP